MPAPLRVWYPPSPHPPPPFLFLPPPPNPPHKQTFSMIYSPPQCHSTFESAISPAASSYEPLYASRVTVRVRRCFGSVRRVLVLVTCSLLQLDLLIILFGWFLAPLAASSCGPQPAPPPPRASPLYTFAFLLYLGSVRVRCCFGSVRRGLVRLRCHFFNVTS
jgi:hypothetical protein